ncbi:uncharacterized protein LOC133712234 [Rosa rugosa]|uniref:uncharacterized protein LOC133712234 n=1 Tax=Rosa rugosa TaxID=74645 RepID=UPI002B40936F|nr:uncharacterized protein LOC133712234 [Rosa rugosa]
MNMRLASPFSTIESFESEFGTESTRRRATSESRKRKSLRPRVRVRVQDQELLRAAQSKEQIDKDGANPERVMQELSSIGLMLEDYGGDVPIIQPCTCSCNPGLLCCMLLHLQHGEVGMGMIVVEGRWWDWVL